MNKIPTRWTIALALIIGTASLTLQAAQNKPTADTQKLKGKTVAILVADGFEQSELVGPRKALDDAGAKTILISSQTGQVRGWNETDWGEKFPVNLQLAQARAEQFDALLLPGGVMNTDRLRTDPRAVQFIKAFFDVGKPVAAICHGPQVLVEADVVRGRKLTSASPLKTDIRNAGGNWTDAEVINDRGLVTSREPSDIPAFNRKMIEEFAEGPHKPVGSSSPANR